MNRSSLPIHFVSKLRCLLPFTLFVKGALLFRPNPSIETDPKGFFTSESVASDSVAANITVLPEMDDMSAHLMSLADQSQNNGNNDACDTICSGWTRESPGQTGGNEPQLKDNMDWYSFFGTTVPADEEFGSDDIRPFEDQSLNFDETGSRSTEATTGPMLNMTTPTIDFGTRSAMELQPVNTTNDKNQ